MIGTNAFLQPKTDQQSSVSLAQVKDVSTDGVLVQFDGEEKAREKRYKFLQSYAPSVGDFVLCAKISGTYIVIGKFDRR